jgi:hypothetical protein|tara:strand:+ start:1398 stop:1664 length:267 start_codon:yes stop_codon:yes gene_type:complete
MDDTIGGIIIDYIDHQLKLGRGDVLISSHNFKDIQLHGWDKYSKQHNIDSYTREWRRLREKNEITGVTIDEVNDNSRETTWRIQPQAM